MYIPQMHPFKNLVSQLPAVKGRWNWRKLAKIQDCFSRLVIFILMSIFRLQQRSWRKRGLSVSSPTAEWTWTSSLTWAMNNWWSCSPVASGGKSAVVLSVSLWLWSRNCVRRRRNAHLMRNPMLSRPTCAIWSSCLRWLVPLLAFTTARLSTKLKSR